MKRFIFRLESVLELRAAKEREAQEEYVRASNAVSRALRDLFDAQAELHRLHEILAATRGQRCTKNDQLISLNAISYQQGICERKTERLEHFQKAAAVCLQALLAANRAHEVLLRLRSKQQAKHQSEAEKQERNAVDDSVMARFARKKSEAAA